MGMGAVRWAGTGFVSTLAIVWDWGSGGTGLRGPARGIARRAGCRNTVSTTQLTHSSQCTCSPPASSNSTSSTGTSMSAAKAWQRAIQQLQELHTLVGKYGQHLKYNRLRELQAVVASIEALNSQLSSKLHELASRRCPTDAECEDIICVRKVSQPV